MNQSEQTRAVQFSRKRHWDHLVAMPDNSSGSSSGSEGSQTSRHFAVLFHKSGLSWTVTVLHTSIS